MDKIWKFPLEVADVQTVRMPMTNMPLYVALQDGKPHLWALVEDQSPLRNFHVYTVGTGQDIPRGAQGYIGSYQMENGVLVFHVFSGALYLGGDPYKPAVPGEVG